MRYFLFILVLFVTLFFFIAYFAAQKQKEPYEPYETPRVLKPVWPDRLPDNDDPKG